MKKINKLFVFSLLTLALNACSLLDIDESIGLEKDDVFSFVDRTKNSLTYAYTFLPSDYNSIDGASRSCATDDAEWVWSNSNIRILNDGTWNKNNTVDAQWSNYYTAIRATNNLLENFKPEALEKFKYQTSPSYDEVKLQFYNYLYEARFLRAFYHFELAKRYGDIPLADRVFDTQEANTIKRAPFDSVVAFIVKECDTVSKYLPRSYTKFVGTVQETGRVTKGAAMALKSRALLYAASKLHNPTNDVERWKKAALAAQVLIDSAETRSWYALTPYYFDYNALGSTELIMESREIKSNYFEKANFPIGFEGGNTGICPTQNLVDAFEMLTTAGGGEFDWNNPAHTALPYSSTKRDRRLARTVLTDGAIFKGSTIETFTGGKNAQPLEGATKTGYYLRKLLDPNVNLSPAATTTADHFWPIFRYSEILLNYAEAMMEAFPGANSSYTDATFKRSADWAINKLRSRAGISTLNGLTYTNFQRKLRNERRVELAFEDHRFWDIRRWMIGSETINIYGTKIEKSGSTKIYSPNQLITTRVWNDRMNLYPIPASESFINPNLNQNPGW